MTSCGFEKNLGPRGTTNFWPLGVPTEVLDETEPVEVVDVVDEVDVRDMVLVRRRLAKNIHFTQGHTLLDTMAFNCCPLLQKPKQSPFKLPIKRRQIFYVANFNLERDLFL